MGKHTPKFNIFSLKNGDWKTSLSYWEDDFSVNMLNFGGLNIHEKLELYPPKPPPFSDFTGIPLFFCASSLAFHMISFTASRHSRGPFRIPNRNPLEHRGLTCFILDLLGLVVGKNDKPIPTKWVVNNGDFHPMGSQSVKKSPTKRMNQQVMVNLPQLQFKRDNFYKPIILDI